MEPFTHSVGNIPFLIFLLSLKFLNDKDSVKTKHNEIIIFGLFSLVHLSSVIYGLIIFSCKYFLEIKILIFVELLTQEPATLRFFKVVIDYLFI